MADRQGLIERGPTAGWSNFEALLFNLVTQVGLRDDQIIFSKRLRITQAMLDAFDAELAVIKAENAARLPPPTISSS